MQFPLAVSNVVDAALEHVYGLRPLFEPTVVLVPEIIRVQIQGLSESIGFDVETLTYTLGMFLCYPLALLMNIIPFGPARHFFSFLSGAFLLQFTLGVQWIHHAISALVAYAMLAILPRSLSIKIVPAFAMIYCVVGHLHRQYVNYLGWDLDFTGTQMVLTQKLYMLAFNLSDGQVLAKGDSTDKEYKAARKCEIFSIRKLPSLMEYLGYTFCFSTLLSGPAFEFTIYSRACNGSLLYKPNGIPRGPIPSNVWPTLRPFLTCLFCLGVFVIAGAQIPLHDKVDPQKNLPPILKPEFLLEPWWYRYAYMWLALLIVRQKYYFAWKNAEGANNLWYVGFDGFDEKGNAKDWEAASNANIIEFETAPNVQTLSKEWNKKTSLWLTRYVYIRTNGSLAAVYSLSAFWHGFYPGYYLFFLSVPLITACERLGRKKISPRFSHADWSMYRIATMLATSFVVEYMVSAFQMLALDRSLMCWKSHYFIGHIVCLVFYFIVMQLPTPKTKQT